MVEALIYALPFISETKPTLYKLNFGVVCHTVSLTLMLSGPDISQALQFRTDVGYSYTICLASVAYDIVLHLPDEIEYIWMGMDWVSIPKYLYLLSRYQGFLFALIEINASSPNPNATDQFCRSILGWYTEYGGVPLMTTIISVIFMLRVSALYGNSRCVIAFLFALWIVQTSASFGALAYILVREMPYISAVPLAGCQLLLPPSVLTKRWTVAIFWGPCLSTSLVLFLMTLATCWRLPVGENSRLPYRQAKVYPLFSLILKDGTVFFFLIFIVDLIMATQACAGTPLSMSSEILLPWTIAIHSVAGSHLILNLRRMARKPMESSRRQFTSIIFAPRLDNTSATDP
ncbi:hypothetical protein BDQ17DRAFT_1366390 [Cyathus striatus]|nr:hypothetical protein BDQ17DRAFT_1366390 [Cyathus striatus]